MYYHSKERIGTNCSYSGGSVPTIDIKNIAISGSVKLDKYAHIFHNFFLHKHS